jgi:hypothetical protein
METAYTGLAEIGKIRATIGVAVAVCLGLSMCASGGFMISGAKNDKHTSTATAALSNAQCSSNTCSSTATYTVGETPYTLGVTTGNPAPNNLTIAYNPSKPEDANQNPPSPVPGFAFIGIGFLVALIGLFAYWLTMTYKPVAALGGAQTVYDLGKSLSNIK